MLAIFTATALLAVQTSPRDPATLWPLGSRVVEVAELPADEWVSYWLGECHYHVEGDASSLVIDLRESDGYVGVTVSLNVTPSEVRGSASFHSCTGGWFGMHVAGTTCLVTNGTAAVLEFEIYEGGAAPFEAMRGRVALGPAGAELARRISAPARPEQTHRERVEFANGPGPTPTDPGPRFEAFGLVDSLGRRQGLWTVRAIGADRPTLELSWRDGLPDGIYRRYENEHLLLEVGSFRAGFLEGQSIAWRRTGERAVDEWRHGDLVRAWTYASDGTRLREWETGIPVDDEGWKEICQLHTRR